MANRAQILRWIRATISFLLVLLSVIFSYTLACSQVVARFFYDEQGHVTRQERDTNGDRRVDVWVIYKEGQKFLQEEDQNFDGKIDTRYCFKEDQLASEEKVAEIEPPIPSLPFSSVEKELRCAIAEGLL